MVLEFAAHQGYGGLFRVFSTLLGLDADQRALAVAKTLCLDIAKVQAAQPFADVRQVGIARAGLHFDNRAAGKIDAEVETRGGKAHQ
ncbi:hypothetical protein D3C87_1984190 [compost metagenome]